MEKTKVVSIVGPTASGKTEMSIAVAKKFNGEVISADSMQIYKEMNIATAKPDKKEMQGIAHHLIDFIEPEKEYSVAQFVKDAKEKIKDIANGGKLPVIAGGTGLYVNSLLNNIQFNEYGVDYELRERLLQKGDEELLEKLKSVDFPTYEKLSAERNHKRTVRALEIYYQTGKPKSVIDKESLSIESPYDAIKIGLTARDREYIYDRINIRVDLMVEKGILNEAKYLLGKKLSSTASKAIGYKEFIPYFNGEKTLEECKEILKRETRRYAKRQLTWFRRDKEINWLEIDKLSPEELIERALDIIKKGL